MNYTEKLKKAVNLNTYLGTGNPNSQILIIGKEVATDIEDGKDKNLENINLASFNSNSKDWKDNFIKELNQKEVKDWKYGQKENNPLYAFKGVEIKKEGHTWRKYQKLHNFIFDKAQKQAINFQEQFFITEMSVLPSKTTRKAQNKDDFKIKLQERKDSFLSSHFIQDFPIVILACGNYIVGKEIREIFKVDFIQEKGNGKQKYWIHWNAQKTKLVIHTRQLSANVSNDLLLGISNEVKAFLK